jgi:hypothetical protein
MVVLKQLKFAAKSEAHAAEEQSQIEETGCGEPASDNDATVGISGTPIQAGTRRVLTCWVSFESTGDAYGEPLWHAKKMAAT